MWKDFDYHTDSFILLNSWVTFRLTFKNYVGLIFFKGLKCSLIPHPSSFWPFKCTPWCFLSFLLKSVDMVAGSDKGQNMSFVLLLIKW